MDNSLILTDIRNMTAEEWLGFRSGGVGASEVAAVLGLSPYKSSIELFYEKIGEKVVYNVENINMFMGKEMESPIANYWQYWGGSVESLIENFRKKEIQRRCQKVNAYVQNPKYPWLFVSLDRKINKHGNKGEGALEIKTTSGYEADKWESGIPPAHIVQVQTQNGVCIFDYGELCTLKDGRDFDVIPFDFSKELFQGIVDGTHDFWQRCEKGKELVTQIFESNRTFNQKNVEELTAELDSLAPPPDNSQAYADYLKVKYNKGSEGERAGTITELEEARSHKATKDKIKELTDQGRLHENILKNAIGNMEKIDFGKDGFVSWKTDVNGSKRFLNKVK